MSGTLPRPLREAAFLSQFESVGCATPTSAASAVALIPPTIRSTIRSRKSSLYITILEIQSRPRSDQTEATTTLTPGVHLGGRALAVEVPEAVRRPAWIWACQRPATRD